MDSTSGERTEELARPKRQFLNFVGDRQAPKQYQQPDVIPPERTIALSTQRKLASRKT
jgi:hypothetical protein